MPTKLNMAEKRNEKERRTKTKLNRMIDVSSVILELMNLGTVHAEVPQVNLVNILLPKYLDYNKPKQSKVRILSIPFMVYCLDDTPHSDTAGHLK